MLVLISGSNGLIGSAVVDALTQRGDTVHRLVRSTPRADGDVHWNPAAGTIDEAALEGHDAVVHLAAENILGLWTAAKKRAIRESRLIGTRTLATALAGLQHKPRVLVSGSAVGYYGDQGDAKLTEVDTPRGGGFLTSLVDEWEDATAPAAEAGIRVVCSRTGIVQSARGGALKSALLPFKLGMGGRFGSGKQWLSWITLDDLTRIILRAIDDDALSGPVNAVAPNPVTNADYTRTLARVLGRPAFLPVPTPALRALPGGLGQEMLGSQRVAPHKLQELGFEFRWPELEPALRHELGR